MTITKGQMSPAVDSLLSELDRMADLSVRRGFAYHGESIRRLVGRLREELEEAA